MLSVIKSRYRYPIILLRQMVITDFKLRYQGSVLGYLWSLIKPLALFGILYLVFVKFLKIGADIEGFPIYLLLGIVLWTYFTEVTSQGVRAILDKDELIRKVNFPRYVIVLSTAVSALINLVLNLIVVLVIMFLTGFMVETGWLNLLIVAFLIVELFVFSFSVALILSALYVKFRELIYIWEVVLQAAFYATPILYPLSMVPTNVAKVMLMNPMAQIIQDFRYWLITPDTVTFEQLFGSGLYRIIPFAITLLTAIVALWYFRKRTMYFAEEV